MPRRLVLVTAVAAVGLAVAPVSSLAATGDTTISLGGSGLKSLTNQSVKITAGKPATLRGSKLVLPSRDGLMGSSATVVQGGSFSFVKGKRKLRLTTIRLVVGGKTARLTGRLNGKQLTIFTAKLLPGASTLNRVVGAVTLNKSRVTLSAEAAKAIRKKLKLRKTPKRAFGAVESRTVIGGAAATPTRPPSCATELTRPAGAVNVSAVSINWHVRDSFVSYIEGPIANGQIVTLGGATRAGADITIAAPTSGWFDPASGTASISGTGGAHFTGHSGELDLSLSDPIVEIVGACSRATFLFGDGVRRTLTDLAATTPSIAGAARTYVMPGTLSGEAAATFRFYPSGAEFGSMTVSFST